jgi:hypothetical protein
VRIAKGRSALDGFRFFPIAPRCVTLPMYAVASGTLPLEMNHGGAAGMGDGLSDRC